MFAQSWYDTAQVCMNGHIVNDKVETQPQCNEQFCTRCGEPTVTTCPNCQAAIRGYYHVPHVVGLRQRHPPAFCHQCGQPYPWTERALSAARDLSNDLDQLTPKEKETLTESLEDLVKDTPRTTVAAGRFKRLLAKAGSSALDAFRQILIDVLSETAKKIIFPQG